MEAAAYGRLDAARALIQAGADVNLKNSAGAGALKRAERGGHQRVVTLLQEAGAKPDEEGAEE